MTSNGHSRHTRHIGRGTIILILLSVVAALGGTAASIRPAQAGGVDHSYGWPVKPFHRQHPIRGNFGDPRTVFVGRPTFRNLMSGGGTFSFHFGVDVSAPDGTAVYPVRSGAVTVVGNEKVRVSSGDGFAAEYWHVRAAVRPGEQVTAYQTVLGRVIESAHHVHFSEFANGRVVNPLAPGHLAPYADRTAPDISSISFRRTVAGRELAPEFVHGSVHLIADAYDTPAVAVRSPARWRGMPVAPAFLTWRIVRVDSGKTVVGPRVAFDVRRALPSNAAFWSVYARGSHQNMLQFATHRFWRQPGAYLFRLTTGAFDTRELRNGIYRVVVTAADTRGNRSSTSQIFTVFN